MRVSRLLRRVNPSPQSASGAPAREAVLVAKTPENTLRRVLLRAMVVVAIPAQPLVDDSGEFIELRPAHRRGASVSRRNGALEHLPHALARDPEMAHRRALALPVPASLLAMEGRVPLAQRAFHERDRRRRRLPGADQRPSGPDAVADRRCDHARDRQPGRGPVSRRALSALSRSVLVRHPGESG